MVEGMRTRQMLRLARATLWFLLMGVGSTTGASFGRRSVGNYGRIFSWIYPIFRDDFCGQARFPQRRVNRLPQYR